MYKWNVYCSPPWTLLVQALVTRKPTFTYTQQRFVGLHFFFKGNFVWIGRENLSVVCQVPLTKEQSLSSCLEKKNQPLSINENSDFENFGGELHAKKSTCSRVSVGDVKEPVAYPSSCFPEDLSCLGPPRQTRLFMLKCQQLFIVCFW